MRFLHSSERTSGQRSSFEYIHGVSLPRVCKRWTQAPGLQRVPWRSWPVASRAPLLRATARQVNFSLEEPGMNNNVQRWFGVVVAITLVGGLMAGSAVKAYAEPS
jgi:hypothetical protein